MISKRTLAKIKLLWLTLISRNVILIRAGEPIFTEDGKHLDVDCSFTILTDFQQDFDVELIQRAYQQAERKVMLGGQIKTYFGSTKTPKHDLRGY
jgi:hypothetical protein